MSGEMGLSLSRGRIDLSRSGAAMILWSLRQLLYFRQVVSGDWSPRQLALSATLGLVLGLVPKGNLLAAGLFVLLFSLRLNLPAAMLSVLCFSLVGPALDPLTHRIGSYLLSSSRLQGMWTAAADLPFALWTSFNNSVVLGSLVLGLVAAVPFYAACKVSLERWWRQPTIAGLLEHQNVPLAR